MEIKELEDARELGGLPKEKSRINNPNPMEQSYNDEVDGFNEALSLCKLWIAGKVEGIERLLGEWNITKELGFRHQLAQALKKHFESEGISERKER